MFGLLKYTEKKCAIEVINALKKYPIEGTPVYEPERNRVVCGECKINLANIYNKSNTLSRKERNDFINAFIASSIEEFNFSYDNAAHLLVPRLKTKTEIALRDLYMKEQNNHDFEQVNCNFTNNFCIELGIDARDTIRVVSPEHLVSMELTKEEALAIAKKNLFSISEEPFKEVRENLYISQYSDDHDAARLLQEDVIRKLKIKGLPVAFVPSAAVLIICGSEDFEAFDNIKMMIDELTEGQRPLSLNPLILKESGWEDFHPENSDNYAGIHNLITLEKMSVYSEQKEILEKIHEQESTDIFIGTYSVFNHNDYLTFNSIVAWTETVHSWLPKAETITLVKFINDEAETIGDIDFNTALEELGDLMKPLGMNPELYEVKDIPSDERLKLLGII